MKINEVEQLVGITKKSIRFYESEGLLSPERNKDNGYRNYSDEDVELLRKIKLFRKLSVPVEEIRKILEGRLSAADAVRRHIISLEREQKNLSNIIVLCGEMADANVQFDALDTEAYLTRMEQMEQEGMRFMDIKKRDIKKQVTTPVVAAVIIIVLMVAAAAFILWSFAAEPAPLPLVIAAVAVPVLVVIGVTVALKQRIKQIIGGEEDEASKY